MANLLTLSVSVMIALSLAATTSVAESGDLHNKKTAAPASKVLDDDPIVAPHETPPESPFAARGPSPLPTSIAHRGPWRFGPYSSYQVNVTAAQENILGDAANEPSLTIDPNDSNIIAIGWRQFDTVEDNFRQAGCAYSHDGGLTWNSAGPLDPGVFRSDPVLGSDSTGRFYYYSLTLVDSDFSCQMFISTDGGASWTDPIPALGGDKAWIDIDRTYGIGHGNFYAAWDYAGCCENDWFTRSTDLGLTYDDPVPIPDQPMWGVTAVAPDGSVYVAGRRRTTSREIVVAKASNIADPANLLEFDGATQVNLGGRHRYTITDGPNPGGLHGQVWVATDHSDEPSRGNVYVLCSVQDEETDDPLDVHFIRSTDGGVTWSPPIRINDDPAESLAWQWFGTMSVAPNGRIDVIWNDTRESGLANVSRLYYSYSLDTGLTWSENIPLTGEFDSHLGWPQQNKLGDYYDMVSTNYAAHIAYAATFNGEQDVYYLRVDADCNANGISDGVDVDFGTSFDCNENYIPDECEQLTEGSIIYVDTNARGLNNGSSWENAFIELRFALELAQRRDDAPVIWVAEGTYTPAPAGGDRSSSLELPSGVRVYGGFSGVETQEQQRDPAIHFTILSGDLNGDDKGGFDDPHRAENSYRVVLANQANEESLLDGFIIRGGNGNSPSLSDYGAGMTILGGSPVISSCVITENSVSSEPSRGGGVYIGAGSPTFIDCTMMGNEAFSGGGLYIANGEPILHRCVFDGNIAYDSGGGLFSTQALPSDGAQLSGCTFDGNSAQQHGGGMCNWSSSPQLNDCNFNGNSAGLSGGAIANQSGSIPTLKRCTLIGNAVTSTDQPSQGGAASHYDGSNARYDNCLIAENTAIAPGGGVGGAICCDSSRLSFFACTIVGNSASQAPGVYVSNIGSVSIDSSILWNGLQEIELDADSAATVTHSRIDSSYPGSGNINLAPNLAADYSLAANSPCIDTGNPSPGSQNPTVDILGYPRILCGRLDMGAFESGSGDFSCDGVVDLDDYVSWAACATGPGNYSYSYPPGCESFDLDYDGDVDLIDFCSLQRILP